MNAKTEVQQLLSSLPESASFEDIQYAIYVREKVQRGIEAADRGDFASADEVKAVVERWNQK